MKEVMAQIYEEAIEIVVEEDVDGNNVKEAVNVPGLDL